MRGPDLIGGAGWIAFGLAVFAGAWRMDRFEAMGATVYTMPGLVPGLIGVVLMLLGGALALRGWRRRAAEVGPAKTVNARVAITLVLMLAYAAGLVGPVPFAPATAVFVAVFTFVFTPREAAIAKRATVAVVVGVLTAVIVVLVFERLFLVRLP